MFLDHMRPTWVEVNLDAIQANVTALRRLARSPHLMAIVKANGYGHGALPVAEAALSAGADWLGVASVEEGANLRQGGIAAPILVLGYVAPGQAEEVIQHDLRVAMFDLNLADALAQAARSAGGRAHVHLKIDTGMSRVGLRPDEVSEFARSLKDLPEVEVEGVFTHFAAADDPSRDEYTAQQVAGFEKALAELKAVGITPTIRHAANTAGLLIHPESHYDMVRAGIAMYGLPPDPAVDWPVSLTPALSWKSRIGMVKWIEPETAVSYGCTYHSQGRERIATIPVGYADGYSRRLSNNADVLIGGHRCSVVGRVCMDQLLVRVPDGVVAAVGDEVVLIGEQGGERITATELAQRIETINYEVICSIGQRVPRIYWKDGAAYK